MASATQELDVFVREALLRGHGREEIGQALVAAGGRVLCPSGRGASLAEARARAYALLGEVDWPEAVYRRDIGWRALPGDGA